VAMEFSARKKLAHCGSHLAALSSLRSSGHITGIMRKITRLVIFPNRLMFSASLRT